MDEVTITITVTDWLDTPTSETVREALLRDIGDRALTFLCRQADERGLSIHVEHDLEY